MATRTVRVIRTWDVLVPVEYGESDEKVLAQVTEEFLDANAPDAEKRLLMPAEESKFATLQEWQAAEDAKENEEAKPDGRELVMEREATP